MPSTYAVGDRVIVTRTTHVDQIPQRAEEEATVTEAGITPPTWGDLYLTFNDGMHAYAFSSEARPAGPNAYNPTTDLAGQEHVLLDALDALRDAIATGDAPWASYDSDGNPTEGDLCHRDTYLSLIDEARARITVQLSKR